MRRHAKRKGQNAGEKNKIVRTAVAGAGRGAGVTHMCILLAEYCAIQRGQPTALVECNTHRDFRKLGELLYGKVTMPFRLNGVDYFEMETYPEKKLSFLQELEKKGYHQIILDLGTSFWQKEELIAICDKRIFLSGSAPWCKQSMETKRTVLKHEKWSFLDNLASWGIPYCPLGKAPDKELKKLLDLFFDTEHS